MHRCQAHNKATCEQIECFDLRHSTRCPACHLYYDLCLCEDPTVTNTEKSIIILSTIISLALLTAATCSFLIIVHLLKDCS